MLLAGPGAIPTLGLLKQLRLKRALGMSTRPMLWHRLLQKAKLVEVEHTEGALLPEILTASLPLFLRYRLAILVWKTEKLFLRAAVIRLPIPMAVVRVVVSILMQAWLLARGRPGRAKAWAQILAACKQSLPLLTLLIVP